MSPNKRTVDEYMEGFRHSDHPRILACLTDDVEWEIPGAFHIHGKAAYDAHIESPAFVGNPIITVTRMIEEHDVVIAEGRVRVEKAGGAGWLELVFSDTFEMRDGKIRKLTSYLVVLP